MINFKLKDFDKIIPVGQEPDLRLSWFWLTDGDLWLTFGDQTIYEYSKAAIEYFSPKLTPYNDYYIVRFLEDFTQLFEKLSESIPDQFYILTRDLPQFRIDIQKWLDIYETDENEHSEFYFEEYHKFTSWIYERCLNSMHLVGGPYLYFFRSKDNVRIVWDTEHTLENGISIWTAKNGSFEMGYLHFVEQVKEFGKKFFDAMDKQIELAVAKDWGNIQLDKAGLVKEHQERKDDFYKNLSLLESPGSEQTNWAEIEQLYNRMRREIT